MLNVGINLWRTSITHGGVIADPPRAASFSVVAPATANTGAPISFTVHVLDQHGAAFPSYAGTVHFASNDPAAVLPANATLTAGAGTFSATLNTVGSKVITATDTVTSSITGTSGAITVAAAVVFNPADLFKSGETGGWWDPSDMSTMFQDVAGTIPAVMGQRVALIKDKSGNGNDLSNSFVVTQPTLKNNGAYNYFDFDQNGPSLYNTAMSTFIIPITKFTAVNQYAWTDSSYLSEGQNYGIGLYQHLTSPDLSLSATPGIFVGPVNPQLETGHVIMEVFDGASSSLRMDTNAPVSGDTGLGPAPGGIWYGGGNAGNTAFRFYGGLAVGGRVLTTTEINGTEAFFATKLPPPPPPYVPPQVSGVNATIAADFAGKGYWAGGTSIPSIYDWITAIGGTYSRGSEATYLQGGVVHTVPANVPRFPTAIDGTAQGIRLTGAATNMLIWSQDFTNAAWASYGGVQTISGNATAAPDGTTTASKIVPDTSAQMQAVAQNGLPVGTNPYTHSAFFKKAEYNFGFVGVYDAGSGGFQCMAVDLTTGAITTTDPSVVAKAIPLANGWWLASFTRTAGGSSYNFYLGASPTGVSLGSGLPQFAGDGTSGVYAWGAQMTQTSFPCDHIPTTTATVTQAADNFSFPFTQTIFSSLVGSNDLKYDGTGSQRLLAAGADAQLFYGSGVIAVATQTDLFISSGAINISLPNKEMVSGDNTSATLAVNGGINTGAGAITSSPPASMYVGSSELTSGFMNGNLSQLAIWNALVAPTAEMQRLTT